MILLKTEKVCIIISGILQKIIFGNQSMIFAMSCISLLGSVVWGHHMYSVYNYMIHFLS